MLLSCQNQKNGCPRTQESHNTLPYRKIEMPLIFCVFATKRGVITKYAKYEEVGCQENSEPKPI
ncbi:hypothetical protein CJ231_00620 [Hoylesella buccalis]|uniref:Uncharacterized protein n=1 Tax=Hoylesella buccalis TaxID=28127 RepID=A0A2N6QTG8_9BACT|nr:hypothetical protein CJ231_00620 [Hoylesella buccalis]